MIAYDGARQCSIFGRIKLLKVILDMERCNIPHEVITRGCSQNPCLSVFLFFFSFSVFLEEIVERTVFLPWWKQSSKNKGTSNWTDIMSWKSYAFTGHFYTFPCYAFLGSFAWWCLIPSFELLQLSIGRQWKEFLDYSDSIGFIFHVSHHLSFIDLNLLGFTWSISHLILWMMQDDAKRLDRNAKNRYTVWAAASEVFSIAVYWLATPWRNWTSDYQLPQPPITNNQKKKKKK